MFGYEDISLHLAFPAFYFFLALILLGGYSYYVYRYTIPPVSKSKKIFLVSLRTIALLLLLFIFFEPVLTFTKKVILKPINLIFVDNSRSMRIDDGTKRENNAREISEAFLSSPITTDDEVFLFGDRVRELPEDSLVNLNFNDAVTNISQIFSSIDKAEKNYASITMITDGDVTSGSNSVYAAKNLGLPVFTIGIGDTSQIIDIAVRRVLSNELLYSETPTTIEATIQQTGLTGKSVMLSLLEDNVIVEQKNIIMDKAGIQNESFTYTPKTPGEKKLTVNVSHLPKEFSSANNSKVFYINVLSNKVRVMLLAGSPSSDAEFIKNSLKQDKNLNVKSLIQISDSKFAEANNNAFADSADVFFMIGIPGSNSPADLLNKVYNRIRNERIPFFIVITNGTDFNRLNNIQTELPFILKNRPTGFGNVQPYIAEENKNNPIIQNNAQNIMSSWNDLPPVYQPDYDFLPKPESNVIAKVKINNIVVNSPLIVSRSFSGRRSIAVLAGDIWKWKLQTVRKRHDLFDRFILNSLKWLNASDQNKRIKISTTKKNYSVGELIEFTGQVYDESLNPVTNAEVKINITADGKKYELEMQSTGNGLYEGQIRINEKGDYTFNGQVFLDGTQIGSSNGRFNVGDMNIEMVNTRMNYELLNLLANETNGEFVFAKDYQQVIDKIKDIYSRAVKDKILTSDLTLWSDEWLMILAIFLFSLEWFLRKRSGML